MRKRAFVRWIAVLLCVLLLALPALAQEEAPPAEPEAPAGVGTLILLLGVGAVVIVGGAIIGREFSSNDGDE